MHKDNENYFYSGGYVCSEDLDQIGRKTARIIKFTFFFRLLVEQKARVTGAESKSTRRARSADNGRRCFLSVRFCFCWNKGGDSLSRVSEWKRAFWQEEFEEI